MTKNDQGFLKFLDDLAAEVHEISEANPNALWVHDQKIAAMIGWVAYKSPESLDDYRGKEDFIRWLADTLIRVLDCAAGLTDEFGAVVAMRVEHHRQQSKRG